MTNVFLYLLLVWPFVVSVMILRRLDTAANENNGKVKFFLVDLFGLFFLFQLPLVLIGQFFDRQESMVAGVILAMLMLIVGWATIRTVSKAGITETRWRSMVSMFVIPTTYIGAPFLALLTLRLFNTTSGMGQLIMVAMIGGAVLLLSDWITRRAVVSNSAHVVE